VLFFNLIWIKSFKNCGFPSVLRRCPISAELPQVLERLNLLFALINLGVLRGSNFEVCFLLIDLNHTFGQLGKSLVDFVNHFVVLVFSLLDVILFEFVDISLDFIEFILESFSLKHETLLNFITLDLKIDFLLLDAWLDLVGLLVSLVNDLNVVINKLNVRLFVQ
jgi:hypothetical protein